MTKFKPLLFFNKKPVTTVRLKKSLHFSKFLVLTVITILVLSSFLILIKIPTVKADGSSNYLLTFSVYPSNSGSISWVDNTEPYHDGETSTTYSETFPLGDILTVTSTANSGDSINYNDIFNYSDI